MTEEGLRLSVDYWHSTVAAAIRTPDGRVLPVPVDGGTVAPTGVAVDADGTLRAGRGGADAGSHHPHSYVRIPSRRLFDDKVTVNAIEVDPVDLLSATLALVAQEAREITGVMPQQVVISVPAGWVARQRRAVQAAAEKAGLTRPELVTGAESIAREQMARGTVIPAGGVIVVCRLDTTVGELTVLRYDGDTFEPVATPDLGELGETEGTTLPLQAATALARALDPDHLTADQITHVFAQVPTGLMPELTTALAAVSVKTAPVQVTDLAAAFGSLRPAGAEHDPTPRKTSGGAIRSATTLTVAWSGAALLTYQMFNSATAYPVPGTHEKMLQTELYAWGLVPVFATIGAVAAALLFADMQPRRETPAGKDRALGSALILVAALGVGVAAALALVGAQHFGTNPAPLLLWTLGSTTPLAATLLGLGIVVARAEPPTRPFAVQPMPWRERLRFPVAATVLATVPTVAIVASYVAVPYVDSRLWWRMEHIGAYLLGWALATLLTDDTWRRVILGSVLSAAAAYAASIDTAAVVSSCLVGAMTLWWLVRLFPFARAAILRLINPGIAPQSTPHVQ